jgi:hypothetical protein
MSLMVSMSWSASADSFALPCIWNVGVTMRLIDPVSLIPVLIIGSTLSACVTEDMTSELSQPNFGRRQLNSDENVDSRLLMNGLYAPKPYGVSPYAATPYSFPCSTAEFRCSQQAQSAWSSFDP